MPQINKKKAICFYFYQQGWMTKKKLHDCYVGILPENII